MVPWSPRAFSLLVSSGKGSRSVNTPSSLITESSSVRSHHSMDNDTIDTNLKRKKRISICCIFLQTNLQKKTKKKKTRTHIWYILIIYFSPCLYSTTLQICFDHQQYIFFYSKIKIIQQIKVFGTIKMVVIFPSMHLEINTIIM